MERGTPSVAEVVGTRVRLARASQSQAQLGENVRDLLGHALPRQTISLIEKGEREVTPEELIALSFALDQPVWWFLLPTDVVQFSAGWQMDRESLLPMLRGEERHDDARAEEDALRAAMKLLGKIADRASVDARFIHDVVYDPKGGKWLGPTKFAGKPSGSVTRAPSTPRRSGRRSTD